MLILRYNDNASNNFGPYEDDKSTLEKHIIEEDHKDLVAKISESKP